MKEEDKVVETPGALGTSLSERSRRQFELERSKDAPGFGEAFMKAREIDAVGPAILDAVEEGPGPESQKGFRFDDKLWEEVTKGVPNRDLDIFDDATSEQEARNIKERYDKERKIEKDIASAGWKGTSARLLAGVLDETALTAAVATEGAATPWILTAKAGRLARTVRAAAVSGGTEAGLETFVQSQRETKGAKDVLYAGLVGGALGAPFGALARGRGGIPPAKGSKPADQAYSDAADAVSESQATDVIQSMTKMNRPDVEEAVSRLQEGRSQRSQAKADLDAAQKVRDELADETPEGRVLREEGLEPRTRNSDGSAPSRDDLRDDVVDALTPKREQKPGRKEAFKIWDRANSRIREAGSRIDFERAEADQRVSDLNQRVNELDSLIKGESERLTGGGSRSPDDGGVQRPSQESTGVNLEAALRGASPGSAPDLRSQTTGSKSAGAAQQENVAPDSSLDDPLPEEATPESASRRQNVPFKNVRVDMFGRLAGSKSPTMELLARDTLSDPVSGDSGRRLAGQGEQVVQPASAAETSDKLFQSAGFHFLARVLPAWKKYAKANDLNFLQRAFGHAHREEFMNRVTHVVRTGEDPGDENIAEAAKAVQEGFQDMLKRAKDAKVAGFEDVAENQRYIQRQWDPNKFRELVADEGVKGDGIRQLLKQSILNASEDMPEEVADKMAKAVFRRFNEKGHGIQADFNRAFFGRDLDGIQRTLEEAELSRAEIDEVMEHIKRADNDAGAQADAGNSNFAKRRIEMDENTSITLRDGRELHFSDLTDNNAERLFMNYARNLSGHIALAKKLKPRILETRGAEHLAENGVKVEPEFNRLKNVAATEGATQKELDDLQMAFNMIVGRPPEDATNSAFHHILRFARDWNFVRLMGQVGFAQVAELGPLVSQTGIGTVLKNVPKAKQIVQLGKDGKFQEPMMRELAEFDMVFGTERMIFQPNFRMEEWGMEGNSGIKWLNKTDNAMQVIKRGVSDVSGMSGITIYLQRMAGLSAGHKLLKLAKEGKLDNARMRSLGIDSDMAQRIQTQLNTHRGQKQMEGGQMADVMNLKNWDDTEAREVLMDGMHRWGSRMVQRNLIGELPAFMHTTVGQVLGQFRSFMLNAYQKQLLQGANMKDFQTFTTFSFSMMFAGLSYTAQQSLNSLGEEDPEEFRKERLSLQNIGLSAFQRAGFASMIPGAVDTILPLTPTIDEGIFNYGRSSGLATDFLKGNPSVDLFNSVQNGLQGALSAPTDGAEFDQTDFDNLWGIMAMNNVTGIRNVGNLISRELPRKNRSREPRTLEEYLDLEDAR